MDKRTSKSSKTKRKNRNNAKLHSAKITKLSIQENLCNIIKNKAISKNSNNTRKTGGEKEMSEKVLGFYEKKPCLCSFGF